MAALRLPPPLAPAPAALPAWLGIRAAPHLQSYTLGWRAFAVGGFLSVCLIITWYAVRPLRSVNAWAHGPYPPPSGLDKGWYLRKPVWPRQIGLLLVAMPVALPQLWIQAAHNGGRTLDAGAAIGAFFFWAGLIRGVVASGEPARRGDRSGRV